MDECDMLVFILISFLENCKEEHIKNPKHKTFLKCGLDETKILKTALKHYAKHHTNVSNLILNYFNSK